KASPATVQAQKDADLECRDCSEDSSGSAGALEGSLLVYRTDCRSSWRAVGAAMEGHRLGCENDHFRERFLERPFTGFKEDRPGARQAYAGKSRAYPGEASRSIQEYRTQ